jgi:hypothetical protein
MADIQPFAATHPVMPAEGNHVRGRAGAPRGLLAPRL